jgi:hypothetical protein
VTDFMELLENLYPNGSFNNEYKRICSHYGIEITAVSSNALTNVDSPIRGLDDDDDDDMNDNGGGGGSSTAAKPATIGSGAAPEEYITESSVAIVDRSRLAHGVDEELLQYGELDDMTSAVQHEFNFVVQRIEEGVEFAELASDTENLIVIPPNRDPNTQLFERVISPQRQQQQQQQQVGKRSDQPQLDGGYIHMTLDWMMDVDEQSMERVLIECQHELPRRSKISQFLYHLTRNDWKGANNCVKHLAAEFKSLERQTSTNNRLIQILQQGMQLSTVCQ